MYKFIIRNGVGWKPPDIYVFHPQLLVSSQVSQQITTETLIVLYEYNNILDIIPQEGRGCTNLTRTLGVRDIVSNRL